MAFFADRAAFQPRGGRAGVPPVLPGGGTGTLARPRHLARHLHNHTHTRTRTEDTNTDLPPSRGLVNGGFWVCAQCSATQRQPESFHKPPRVGALVVVGMTFGVERAAYLSARGGARGRASIACQHGS